MGSERYLAADAEGVKVVSSRLSSSFASRPRHFLRQCSWYCHWMKKMTSGMAQTIMTTNMMYMATAIVCSSLSCTLRYAQAVVLSDNNKDTEINNSKQQ